MTDLKQLWLIDIDPNKLDKVNNTLIMQNGCLKVKQLGHFCTILTKFGGQSSILGNFFTHWE